MRVSVLIIAFSFLFGEFCTAQTGIYFDGSNDYVTFGVAPSLGGTQFTLEIWFMREGAGLTTNTGTGGLKAFPLITKGRNESEGSTVDENYFLGIDSASNVLAADFEETTPGPSPGLNHPILGVTPICYHVWYHAAATYDGATWRLYLNGNLESSLVVNRTPQGSSIQHAALATGMNSSGTASGFFNGRLDDARIWNYARSQNEISNNFTSEISSSVGLVGRFGMNEGSGNTIANSGTANVTGSLVNGPTWVQGCTYEVFANVNPAIRFLGSNAYVPFGNPSAIRLSQFTLEAWFKRKSNGVATTTGTGGVNAEPIVAKGRGEADGDNKDMNYFLGIDPATNLLVADFEEGTGQPSPGLNHPVTGATPINNNTWYHAAATYDGSTWKLYLNGVLDATLAVGRLPQNLSIQHASIGSALNSSGTSSGYFNGVIDEVRIWNSARSQSAITSTINQQLTGAHTGMVARWSMNEGCGTTVRDSSGSNIAGTVSGSNWFWDNGSPFNANANNQPNQPVVVSPANNSTNVSTNPTLSVTVSDPDGDPLTVEYFIRQCPPAAPADFTIVGLPDTQFYTSQLNGGTNSIYKSQMNWVLNNRVAENIVFVEGLGDCVQNGDNSNNPIEWQRADTSMKIIENPVTTTLTDGIPYGINVGNHDQSPAGDATGTTNLFNQYFGHARFDGRGYYGGHMGSTNNNNYALFSVSGLDFIIINLEYNTSMPASVVTWMQNLLTTYSNRRAIIGSHYILNADGTFGAQGQAIYNAVKNYPNVFLTLSGHVTEESRRTDTFSGNTITSIMSDYQSRTNGGNGWLRLMKFSPSNNTVSVKTYSPFLNQFETDASSQFSFSYNMQSQVSYSHIGSASVNSGGTANTPVTGLLPNTCYQWYVTVSDGVSTVTGSPSTFTTGNASTPVTINLKAFLEGFYRGSGTMASVSNPAVCDTVTLELHSPTSPYSLIQSVKGTLSTSGNGSFVFPNSVLNNSYYIVLKHRNCLETWSASSVNLNSASFSYDFSTAANKAFGNKQRNLNDGRFAIYSGDVNQDGTVSTVDYNLIQSSSQIFTIGYNVNDLSGDKMVESSDYSLVENNIVAAGSVAKP